MYILYLDESGSPGNQDEAHFVIAGCAVFERQTYFVHGAMERFCRDIFEEEDAVEFHASHMAGGKGAPWRRIGRTASRERLAELYDLIGSQNVVLFGAVVEKQKALADGRDPVELAFKEVCQRFDIYLANREDLEKNDLHRGLVVMDRNREEDRLRPLVLGWRRAGTEHGRLRHFAEVPLFADSRATRLLQVADLVAFALFRRYEHGDAQYLDRIQHKFDCDASGRINGMLHYCRRHFDCPCSACVSRRVSSRLPGADQP